MTAYPFKVTDTSLISVFPSLGEMKVETTTDEPINHLITSTTDEDSSISCILDPDEKREDKDVVCEKHINLVKTILTKLSLYSSQYKGQVSPMANYGCHLVARKLNDRYDKEKKRFLRQEYLSNDYMGIIAYEQSLGNMLIAFDITWILAGLAQYVENLGNYDVIRSEVLREHNAGLNPVTVGDVPFTGWMFQPNMFAGFPEVTLNHKARGIVALDQLRIYELSEPQINLNGSVFMIFAPITVDEAVKINLYLYRNIDVYSWNTYLCIRDLPLSTALDFQYLYPVDLTTIGDFVVFSSSQLKSTEMPLLEKDVTSMSQLDHVWHFNTLSFVFRQITDLDGTYAAYLLAEATFYEFVIRWQDRTLYIGDCGYISALDLRQHFADILNNIVREGIVYSVVPDLVTTDRRGQSRNVTERNIAAQIVKDLGLKCFPYLGKYYIASIGHVDTNNIEPTQDISDFSEVELVDPLKIANQMRSNGKIKEYFELLGYDTSENPIGYKSRSVQQTISSEQSIDQSVSSVGIYNNEIKLGHRTSKVGDEIFTVYYYESTYGTLIDVYEVPGRNDKKIKDKIQELVRSGYFFTEYMKNITRSYPGFIPSRDTIPKNIVLV